MEPNQTAPSKDTKKANALGSILSVILGIAGLLVTLGTNEGRSWLCQKLHILCNKELKLRVYSYDDSQWYNFDHFESVFGPKLPDKALRNYAATFIRAPERILYWELEIIYPIPEGAEARAEVIPVLDTPAALPFYEPRVQSYHLRKDSLSIPAKASAVTAGGRLSDRPIADWPTGRYRLLVTVKGENVIDHSLATEFEIK